MLTTTDKHALADMAEYEKRVETVNQLFRDAGYDLTLRVDWYWNGHNWMADAWVNGHEVYRGIGEPVMAIYLSGMIATAKAMKGANRADDD